MTEQEIKDAILNETLFGIVRCSIKVPEQLKNKFADMPPIFKNSEVSIDDIGDHMRQYAEDNNLLKKPTKMLISSYFAKDTMFTTPLLKWYMNHGLEITDIFEVVEYTPKTCFKEFGEKVCNARRGGDKHPELQIIAETNKLKGNCCYGKTATNQEKHRNVNFVLEGEASRLINSHFFRHLDIVNDKTYEVESCKVVIKLDLSLQIAFFVYNYAKLSLLEFKYDFLGKYLSASDYELCFCDTDSMYMALAGEDIDSLVKPELKEEYLQNKNKWFPRDDTPENAAFDKRTPLLWKVEYNGDGMVALNSKIYFCFGNKNKFSCKGLNKQRNEITKELYLDVLKTKESSGGVNVGFRMFNSRMCTHVQQKLVFSYLYTKRKVLEDGVTTIPLDI